MKDNILVVEDDEDIQQLVSFNLIKAGFNVSCADSGEQGLDLLDRERFDLVLLDIMLPGMDGLEICTQIKKQYGQRIAVILLTAKSEEDDIVCGFGHGADDYVTKPFSPKVLIARIQALLRRKRETAAQTGEEGDETISIPPMLIHRGRHQVLVRERPVHLTNTEFTILEQLARRPGWVFTRQQLIDATRGYDYLITPRAIDVQIFGLRKKLGEAGRMIETVRGVGYRLRPEDEQ